MPIKRLERTRKAYNPEDFKRAKDFDWNGSRWCGEHKMKLSPSGQCHLCVFAWAKSLTKPANPIKVVDSDKKEEKPNGPRKP